MKRTLGILCALIIIGGTASGAPYRDKPKLGFRNYLGGQGTPSIGLIDPSKLSVSHAVSFGATVGNGASLMQSLYTARFGYKLSNPVTLSFLLGVQNSRFGGSGDNLNLTSPIGGVQLEYRPSKNFLFRIDVQQSTGSALPLSNYPFSHGWQALTKD